MWWQVGAAALAHVGVTENEVLEGKRRTLVEVPQHHATLLTTCSLAVLAALATALHWLLHTGRDHRVRGRLHPSIFIQWKEKRGYLVQCSYHIGIRSDKQKTTASASELVIDGGF